MDLVIFGRGGHNAWLRHQKVVTYLVGIPYFRIMTSHVISGMKLNVKDN